MNERIRMVREHFKLSRAAFGEKLGVSGDVINNLERGRVEIKASSIKLICSVYSVDDHWLRTGEGEMFQSTPAAPTGTLDAFIEERGLSQTDRVLIDKFAALDESSRQLVVGYVLAVADEIQGIPAPTDTSEPERTGPDIMAELAELKRQNQELAAKIAAMEEEEEAAHWEETAAEVSAFLSGSAGRSEQSKKTKK